MRGKHRGQTLHVKRRRIIPAHAGQTPTWSRRDIGITDHPRACGANACRRFSPRINSGSSPRMRGKQQRGGDVGRALRIIPAHAGQTSPDHPEAYKNPDHPRACGANGVTSGAATVLNGSSPRMRGKLVTFKSALTRVRIIPAHAGQTPTGKTTKHSASDHPRACGANVLVEEIRGLAGGSSPRMRGKQSDFMRKLLSAGPSIIGFAQWLQSSYYCSCLQSSAKTPISRGTTPTSLFLGFQNSITLLLLT